MSFSLISVKNLSKFFLQHSEITFGSFALSIIFVVISAVKKGQLSGIASNLAILLSSNELFFKNIIQLKYYQRRKLYEEKIHDNPFLI